MVIFFKVSKVGIILEMPCHINAMCIAGSKHNKLHLGGNLLEIRFQRGQMFHFQSFWHDRQTQNITLHRERRKGPKKSQNVHQRSVVSRVSPAEEKSPQSGFSVQMQSWKSNLGRMLEQVTQQRGLLVSAKKYEWEDQNLTHWTKTLHTGPKPLWTCKSQFHFLGIHFFFLFLTAIQLNSLPSSKFRAC